MAESKSDPVRASGAIYVNGALAFAAGDLVPADHARRLGITGKRKVDWPIRATADDSGIISTEPSETSPEAPL